MKRSLHWLGAVALAAAAPLAVAVEVEQTEGMPSFSSVDEDEDGYISVQEASTVPAIQFSSADKDGDRRLSPDEYTAAVGRDAEEAEEEGQGAAVRLCSEGLAVVRFIRNENARDLIRGVVARMRTGVFVDVSFSESPRLGETWTSQQRP